MDQDRVDGRDLERSVLRLRLAGIALGATLLILAPRSDQTAAGAALLGYTAAVLIQRLAADRRGALPVLAVLVDVLYAAGLSHLLPTSVGTWALYAFAIGTAAIGFGAVGAAMATAGSILAYDLIIATRSEELRPSDLWPVQLLLAIGLLVAELVWAVNRGDTTRRRLRTFALAQRDLIAARDEDELLDRLADHAVRSFGAGSAWIEVGTAAGLTVRHPRGTRLPDELMASTVSSAWLLDGLSVTRLRCTFGDAATAKAGEPVMRDLVTDAAPLLAAVRERSRLAHAKATLDRTLAGVAALEHDQVTNAVLAEVLSVTTAIVGPAALVRSADGTVVAGDLSSKDALALVRDATPPALVRDRANAATGVVVSAGPGLALVALGTKQELTDDDLRALAMLGEIAAAASVRIAERDGFVERGEALERHVAELADQLRARDDAVASAVHELRTPLTSVHAYAQLTSRNLQAVQQQVKRLDRLIGDLLRLPGEQRMGLILEDIDLLHEARQAGRRTTLVAGRQVNVSSRGDGPYTVRADKSRIEQVLENLLGNAVKFSPAGDEIDIEIDRSTDEVIMAVTDTGAGIPADELQRIFERYYRGVNQRATVLGEGIGLAVSREIIAAHGGRIWAASEGPAKGSTLFVALPAISVAAFEAPTEGAAVSKRHPA